MVGELKRLHSDSAWDDRLKAYTWKVSELPEGVYWHLYLNGEKVNGGIADSDRRAEDEARRLAVCDYFFKGGTTLGPRRSFIDHNYEYLRRWRDGDRDYWDENQWDD